MIDIKSRSHSSVGRALDWYEPPSLCLSLCVKKKKCFHKNLTISTNLVKK